MLDKARPHYSLTLWSLFFFGWCSFGNAQEFSTLGVSGLTINATNLSVAVMAVNAPGQTASAQFIGCSGSINTTSVLTTLNIELSTLNALSGNNCTAQLLVPIQLGLVLNVVNGDATVSGQFGELKATVTNGAANIHDVTALNTALEVTNHNLNVTSSNTNLLVRGENGDFILNDFAGTLDIQRVNSTLKAKKVKLEAETVNRITLTNGDTGISSIGGVNFENGKRAGLKIQARTVNGEINIKGNRGIRLSPTKRSAHYTYSGKRPAKLILKNINGDINIK